MKYIKLFLSISIVILFTANSYSQTFSFVRTSPAVVHGSLDSVFIKCHAEVNNLTGSTFNITFRMTNIIKPATWDVGICTWVMCYAPGLDSITESCPPGVHIFDLYFYHYGNSGTGSTTIVAKKFTNPAENYSQTFSGVTDPIGIKQISSVVKDFELSQNYPNPFNPSTRINFSIPSKDYVYLRVYDILGREVKTLVDNELNAGEYEFEFDAHNLTSGIYYYSLRAGDYVSVKKMVLVK
jgi:hypothetical protein